MCVFISGDDCGIARQGTKRLPPTPGTGRQACEYGVLPNDWVAQLEVDLAGSREASEPVLQLLRLGSLV